MSDRENLERLRAALREAIRRSGRTQKAVSEELGRHPTYLGRLLRGQGRLRVEEVCHLLARLDVRPYELFFPAFPLGGLSEARLQRMQAEVREPTRYPSLAGLTNRELTNWAAWEMDGENPSSVALALQAGELLRDLIRRKGTTQTRVAPALGLSARALGKALAGHTELTFEVVFGVLDEIGITPGRFVLEWLSPDEGSVVDRMRWLELLDQAEERRQVSVEALAENRRRREEEEAGKAEPGAEPS